jgi:hypothetical protein
VRLQRVKMGVVGDQMRGFAIQRTEEERHVIGILRVVLDVEETDAQPFALQHDGSQKVRRRVARHSTRRQLFRVFEKDV